MDVWHKGAQTLHRKTNLAFDARFNLLLVNTNLAAYTSLSVVKNTF